jgi:hypothetical protein
MSAAAPEGSSELRANGTQRRRLCVRPHHAVGGDILRDLTTDSQSSFVAEPEMDPLQDA